MSTHPRATDKKTAKVPSKPTKKAAASAKAPVKTIASATPAKPARVKAKLPAKKIAKAAPVTSAAAVNARVSPKRAAPQREAAIPPEQRRNYVEVAAYYIAERHGFTAGRESADWKEAEAEINRLLEEGQLKP